MRAARLRRLGIVACCLALAATPAISPVPANAVPTATASAEPTAPPWSWPVAGPRAVLRPFVAPAEPWSPGHRGVDLAAESEVLYAPAAGTVRFAGWVVDRPVLSIDHGPVISSYEPVTSPLRAGEPVAAGQPIGTVLAGHCDARCVHLGTRVDGEYRNPLLWLGGVPRAVLLPTRPVR